MPARKTSSAASRRARVDLDERGGLAGAAASTRLTRLAVALDPGSDELAGRIRVAAHREQLADGSLGTARSTMPVASASTARAAEMASSTCAGPNDSVITDQLRMLAASWSFPAARACASACCAAAVARAARHCIQRMLASRNPAHASPTSSPRPSNTLRAATRCSSARRASNRPASTSSIVSATSPNAWKRGSTDALSSLLRRAPRSYDRR